MSKLTYDPGVDKIPKEKTEEQMRFISQNFDQIKSIVNNGLLLADNFDGKILNMTFSSANTDTSAAHGLGRVPQGYLVLKRSASMIVYDGSTSWSSSSIFLKSSATGTISVLVY